MTRVITVTSGKGGVGKTNISANLALCLGIQGYRTCLFDADLGLANINILLGLYPEYNLEDLILKDRSIKDIMINNYRGIDIIPGSSGLEKIANLDAEKLAHLTGSFSELDKEYDFFIFDTSAGVSRNVISFCMSSSEVILIVTPEPTSLTDGYALLKILSLNGFTDSVMVAVNQCKNIQNAKLVYTKFKETVQRFLPIKIVPLGAIMHDSSVIKAVRAQKPFIFLYPNSSASNCIKKMATHLVTKKAAEIETHNLETFWTRCLKVFKEPLHITGTKGIKEPEKSENTVHKKEALVDLNFAEKTVQPSGTTAAPLSSEQRSDSQFVDDTHTAREMRALMESLVKSTSLISQDITVIRQLFENNVGKQLNAKRSFDDSANSEATIIPLDFETFIQRRKNG